MTQAGRPGNIMFDHYLRLTYVDVHLVSTLTCPHLNTGSVAGLVKELSLGTVTSDEDYFRLLYI